MSLVGNCLLKLRKAGEISEGAYRAALALHEGLQGKIGGAMPPPHADAAAALEAARAMAEAARRKKLKAAMNAIRFAEGLQRIDAHPKGRSAGLLSMIQFDPWSAQRGLNVDGHAEHLLGRMFGHTARFLEAYESKAAGLRQDVAGIRNVVRELYGENTGDAIAREAGAGWKAAVEFGVNRARRAGVDFARLDDWRLPQFWERNRVQQYRSDFVEDLMQAVRDGRVVVMDKATGGPADLLKIPSIVEGARDDIIAGRYVAGPSRGFSPEMRVFRFLDADTWLRFADKYGAGHAGIYTMMVGHMRGMAREIALAEVLGPSHRATFNALLEKAKQSAPEAGFIARTVTGPRMAELAYKDVTGELSVPQSEAVAGFFGALRNIKTASSLGSAVISAVPGDAVNMAWAAHAVGTSAGRVIARAMELTVADTATKRAAAARLNIVSHAVMDTVLTSRRFEDQVVGSNATGRLAATVIRASALQAWTEGAKRAFSMEALGMIADQTRHSFDELDPAFRHFLQRYGFSAEDWDVLRRTPLLDVDGAPFFDVDAVGDPKLGDRLMNAVLDERHYAVIEPTPLSRAITTGGLRRGTLIGEMVRSSFMFKSFAMTVLLTHVMRAMTTGPLWVTPIRVAGYVATATLAGAMALQAKQIIAGRDPRDMTTGDFWLGAFVQGGGAGIYGDFINSAVSRGGQGVVSTMLGPVLGELPGTIDLAAAGYREIFGEGEDFGQRLAMYVKRWTPGSTLWYARLAFDRLIFDQIQSLADADYRQSFRRYEQRIRKEFGQQFWWGPGDVAPERAPDMGAALGDSMG